MGTHNIRERKSLVAAFFNANGVQRQLNELQVFVDEHKIDVLLVNETRLDDGKRDPKLVGYACHRADRQTGPGGGTAIFVKNNLKHSVFPLPQFQNLEAVGITIGTVNLVSVYCPPRKLLEPDLLALSNSSNTLIAAGDLNAKHVSWSSRSSNSAGKMLHDFAERHNIDVLFPVEPTYYNYASGVPDTLDIALVKNVGHALRLESIGDLDSDHVPVLLYIENVKLKEKVHQRRLTDWKKFSENLANSYGDVPVISSKRQVDTELERLEERVKEALDASTRYTVGRNAKMHLPPDLMALVKEKRRARRKAGRTLDPDDKREANRIATTLRYALIDHRNDQWARKIDSLSTEEKPSNLWKMSRCLRKQKSSRTRILHGRRGLVYTDEDKAETMADQMESVCRPNLVNVDVDLIEEVERTVRNIPVQETIRPTSPAEVKEIIKSLNPHKSPGPDGITNRAIKNFPLKIVVVLVTICNAIFRYQYFPARWKSADVVFIPKPGKDHKFPQNFRPISLISCLGKVLERIVLARLCREVENLKLIPDEQFGFRSTHSTVHQLSRVVEFASVGLNNKNFVGAVFLDVSKAFDTVWHDGLIYKLTRAGVSGSLTRLMRSFLMGRTMRAKISDCLSGSRLLAAGVPQGSVLSPLLYNLFTADMPVTPPTSLAVYADDTALLVRSLSAKQLTKYLQRAVDDLEIWFQKWGIGVNPDKSSALFISRRKIPPSGNVRMFGSDIPWHNEVKYLGVWLDKRLNFFKHVDYAVTKGKQSFGLLYPLAGRKSTLCIKNKLLLYKAIVRPVMTYGSPVWGHVSARHIRRIQVVQNKFLRAAFSAPWFVRNTQLHAEAKLPQIADVLKEAAVRFYDKAEIHTNPLIREAVGYDEEEPSRVRRPKMALI